MKKRLIIDSLNVFIMNFMVNPTMDNNGNHVGGTLGFLNSVCALMRSIKPDFVHLVWDGEGGSLARRSIYKDYKAGRKVKLNRAYDFEEDALESMKRQLKLVFDVLEFLPVTNTCVENTEADDAISFMCKHLFNKDEKIVVSSDKDFYQIINDKTFLYSLKKKKLYTKHDLMNEYSTLPENFILIKCLMGDKGDNVDGVKSFGKKTVIKFFPEFSKKEFNIRNMIDFSNSMLFSENVTKANKRKYKLVIDSKDLLYRNYRLMQLSNPEISSNSINKIKGSLKKKNIYVDFSLRGALLKKKITVKAKDFFQVMKHQNIRTQKANNI